MTRILFVCLGNICRSPMAEYVMKQMLREAGLAEAVTVASAATSREEEGNDVYPPARRTLLAHGVPCPARASTPLTGQEYAAWDRIIGMEPRNLAVVALIIIFGVGGMTFNIGSFRLGGIGLAAVTGVLLNLVLPRARAEKRAAA